MENNNSMHEKDKNIFFSMELSDIIFWIMRWKWVIVSVTLIFACIGYVFNTITYIPKYTAKASMVVNAKASTMTAPIGNAATEQSMINNQYLLAQQMMETFTTVLTSDRVGTYVANSLDISLDAKSIQKSIKITSAEDTSVVYISATHNDAYVAKSIANTVMEVAPQLMRDVVEVGNVNILDYAKLPIYPESSGAMIYILFSAVIGLVLAVFFIIFFNFLTMKVKNTEDIESKTGLNVFGEIPHASLKGEKEKKYLFTGQTNSGFAESYFMMGAVLRNNTIDKKPYRLIFTSAVAGEGKTTNSINTTTVLADMGYRVLLIDLDMKKPNIARQLGLNVKSMGGIEAVIKGAPIEENIIHTEYGFDFVPCSGSVKHTSKLLSSLRLEMFFKMLDTLPYDYIIIDTAPAHIIADTSVIVKYADGLILVIKQQFTRLKIIMDTITNLKKSGANIIGSILNDVRVYNMGTGYAYKYKYGYGYGYGYKYKYSRYGKYGYGYGAKSYLDSYIDSYGQKSEQEKDGQAKLPDENKPKNSASKLSSILKKKD